MTEQEALSSSTGFHNHDNLIGYLPFMAANYLVGTGKYQFESCGCWGYIVKRI